MSRHSRAMIRHHRERVIANRLRFIRDQTTCDGPWKPAGYFSKVKPLDCSCPMCQSPTGPTTKGKERQAMKRDIWAGWE